MRSYLDSQGFIGVGGGRFFINGVDTETTGVDVVLTWPLETDGAGASTSTFAANFNNTDVTRVPATAPLAALNPPPVLFDRFNVLTFEEGTPDSKFTAPVNWSRRSFGATLRATRYGEVLDPSRASRVPLPSRSARRIQSSARKRWSTSRGASTSRTTSASRSAPRTCSTSIPIRSPLAQPDRQHFVLELLAVRALGTFRVWARDVRVLIALVRGERVAGRDNRKREPVHLDNSPFGHQKTIRDSTRAPRIWPKCTHTVFGRLHDLRVCVCYRGAAVGSTRFARAPERYAKRANFAQFWRLRVGRLDRAVERHDSVAGHP